MCGCAGNVNREVRTSAQIAAEAAARDAQQALMNESSATRRSAGAAMANANS